MTTASQTRAASIEAIRWHDVSHLPRGVKAVLSALRFSPPSSDALQSLSEAEWRAALDFTDRTQLTLLAGAHCGPFLPEWVRARIRRNLAGNRQLQAGTRRSFEEIATRFRDREIGYLLLKGASHGTAFGPDPDCRVSYDIDLFLPAGSLESAREAVASLGYEPLEGMEKFPTDHLPVMVRKTGWEWSGDFFDPAIPAAVDLHFRFWNSGTERFDAPGTEAFWERRVEQDGVPVLSLADRLGYASLHALRHLLQGKLRPSHVYEIAYFLNARVKDDDFWREWRHLHPGRLRCLEAVMFRLAAEWFGARLAPAAEEEIGRLDRDIPLWFERYAAAPLAGLFHPNKDELWLHFCLLDSWRDRGAVFARRMFPTRLPGPVDAVLTPEDQRTLAIRWHAAVRYGGYLLSRAAHHTRALLPTLWRSVAWQSGVLRLERPFWRFLAASSLYNFGMFIFALLYNLYLLDRGYREDFLGWMAGAMTLGGAAGVLPAAVWVRRFGLKRSLAAAYALTALLSALLSAATGGTALLGLAALQGAAASVWAMSFAPAVAALTSERTRALGFSVSTSLGIAVGMAGGLAGGRLPGWIGASSAVASKQIALLLGCGVAALSLWPWAGLRVPSPAQSAARPIYPRGAFIIRFLAAMAVWNLAMGAFDPLFNAYFAQRLHLSVERIGLVFSASQLAQALTILLAPAVLRRLGLVRGVSAMQWATAAALALLAPARSGIQAGVLYAAFMSFQYMGEPGMFTLLMNRVDAAERSGASALYSWVLAVTQAVAAPAGGAAAVRFGYPAFLGAAAALAALAGSLFRRLLRAYDEKHSDELFPRQDGS